MTRSLARPGAEGDAPLRREVTAGRARARGRVALLTQDKRLYPRFTVADTLLMGEELNSSWGASRPPSRSASGLNIALSSHVLPEMQQTCDRVLLVRESHTVLTGHVGQTDAAERTETAR